MGKMATERIGPKTDREIQTETGEKVTETEWAASGIEIEMVTEMSVIKKEVRGVQGIEMGEGGDLMTGKPRTERQSGMIVASEMIGDRIGLLSLFHIYSIVQKLILLIY